MSLKINNFSGIAPKVNPPLLADTMATVAQNCRVDRGSIRPLQGLTQAVAAPTTLGFVPKSIFKYGSPAWLYWANANVDVALSPVPNDTYGRIYYTGGEASYPQYTWTGRPSAAGLAQGMRLGIAQPSNGMIASVGVSGTATGTAYQRYYTFSYVSPMGEEGPPMANPMSVSSITSTQIATLTFNTESLSTYNLGTGAFRRIYRTAQGTTSTTFEFVADVPIGTTTYADSLVDTQLGEIMPSKNWFPPNAAMIGLKATANGFFIGFFGNTLCVSEKYMPHAWTPSNELAFPNAITALAVTTDSIIVFTQGSPYLVTGTDPATLTAIKIDNPQSVPYRKSCVDMGGYIMAASPDGLLKIIQNDIQVATLDHLTLTQWQSYSPTTLLGFYYEGIYIGFSSTTAFMFDTRKTPNVLTTLNGFPTIVGGYNDLSTDTLYLLDSTGIIWSWETGALSTFTWTSKPFRMPTPICPSAGRIYASGAITIQLFADGISVFGPATIPNSNVFRLPAGYKAKEFTMTLSGSNAIDSVAIANTVSELS